MPCVLSTSCDCFGRWVFDGRGGGYFRKRKRVWFQDGGRMRKKVVVDDGTIESSPLASKPLQGPFSRPLTSRSTNVPSSVSSLPREGNLPPVTRPFFVETASPALDLAATDAFGAFFVAGFVFFTDVERGAADAGALLLVETIE